MSFSKNIVIACSYPITTERVGGMDYFFWQLDQELKKLGYTITWLFRSSGSTQHYSDKGLNFEIVQDYHRFQEELLLWLETKKGTSLFIGHFLDYQSSIVKSIKCVLGQTVPCIYVDHMSRPIQRPSFSKRIKRKIKGIAYYNKIDKIIAVSNYVKQSILNEIGTFWHEKTEVVYNGLLIDNYKIEAVSSENKSLAIFCIGHLIKEKGFQVAIEACRKLHAAAIPFKLTIAGDGILRNDLEALAKKQLPIGSYEFLGNITNQPYYLNQSDIVVIPSLWKEAFGYTVVEAMLMKKVVFASNIGGIPEIIDNDSLLFEAGNDQELFLLFKDYHTNKKQYQPFAERLYERARSHFSLDTMVADYIIAIENYL